MIEKNTIELEDILRKTHISDAQEFLQENKGCMQQTGKDFSYYMKNLLLAKGKTQQEVFLSADISERYGYKLLSEEKHTKQRDVILRICYAAELTLDETQKALRMYKLPELYAKIPRDALLMICFNERPGTILDVNEYLKKNGMEILRSSGVQE